MIKLNQLYLPESGIEYVRSRFKKAGKGLSVELLSLLDHGGSTYAIVPEGTSLDRAKQFDNGGLGAASTWKTWLSQHVASLMVKSPNGALLLQDAWGPTPNDPGLDKISSKKFFDNDSIYYFLQNQPFGQADVERTLCDVRGYLFVGGFFIPGVDLNLLMDRMVNENCISGLARTVREAFVGAYDGDSILMWKRDGGVT